jgi:flagellar motor switch protein FliN/FliY
MTDTKTKAKKSAGKAATKSKEKDEPPVMERRDTTDGAQYKRSIYALPVTLDVVIGTARPTVMDLLNFKEGTQLTLDKKLEDPVDLCVDGRIIARGELVEIAPDASNPTGGIGVKIVQVVDVSEDQLF